MGCEDNPTSPDIAGCTNSSALNYQEEATVNDDSCYCINDSDTYDSKHCGDLRVLKDFIDENPTVYRTLTDENILPGINVLELGEQVWSSDTNQRLLKLFIKNQGLVRIPETIDNLEYLTVLMLGRNNIDYLPNSLFNMSSLTKLGLWDNNLSGEISPNFSNLVNLNYLYLDYNQFEGVIPSEIYDLVLLKKLYLARNNLSGTISSDIESLVNLEELMLNHNSLSGALPEELWQLTSLTGLWLQNNNLEGDISSSISNLISLENFNIQNNDFQFIAQEICNYNFINLINQTYIWDESTQDGDGEIYYYFNVENNSFCEPIPTCLENESLLNCLD